MASRRALRWPNPKSGIESGAVGAQAPTSETPSTEYPNQHRPHPAGAATLLPVTGAPNRKGEQRNGSIQIAAQGRGGAIRGRRTRTAEGHGAHRTEVSGQLQVLSLIHIYNTEGSDTSDTNYSSSYETSAAASAASAAAGAEAGAAVTLTNAPFYYTSVAPNPSCYKSGVFYFYDGMQFGAFLCPELQLL